LTDKFYTERMWPDRDLILRIFKTGATNK